MSTSARRRVRRILVTVVLAIASTLTPLAAEASTDAVSQCSSGNLCLWSKVKYLGTFMQTSATSTVNVTSMATVGSVWNRSTTAARIYSGAGGSGSSVCLTPGQQIANAAIPVQSVRILSTTTC